MKVYFDPSTKTLDINSKTFIKELTIHNVLGQSVLTKKLMLILLMLISLNSRKESTF